MVLLDEAGLGRSAAQIFAASGRLLSTVEHAWIQESPHRRDRWRIVPDCSGYLIFIASKSAAANHAQLLVIGARSRHVDIDVLGPLLDDSRSRATGGALSLDAHACAGTDRSIGAAR